MLALVRFPILTIRLMKDGHRPNRQRGPLQQLRPAQATAVQVQVRGMRVSGPNGVVVDGQYPEPLRGRAIVRRHFDAMHRSTGLRRYFDFVLTREDYGRSKPDPEPYLTACARAGLLPGACLAVEDSVRGVTSAVLAGLAVAAIPGAMNHGGDFSAARWQLESVRELPALIGVD